MGQVTCNIAAALRGFAVLVALFVTVEVRSATVDRVAARINGEILTESDLKEFVRGHGESAMTPQMVGNLLDRTLLLQEAKRQKIDISDDELQRQVEETVRSLRGKYPTEKEFLHALAAEGMTLEKLKAELLKRLRTDFQVFQAVTSGATITNQDLEQYEQNCEAEGRSPVSLHLRRLGVAAKKGNESSACDRARELVRKINAEGLSFEDGVRRYSAIPGAQEDAGDLGWMELSKLSAQVIEATRELKPGQATVPIVAGGYANIFYLEGRRGGKAHLLEQRFKDQRGALLERLRKQAQIEIYSAKLSRALPKEYLGRARLLGGRETAAPAEREMAVPLSPDQAPITSPPEPSATPRPKKGFLRFFRKAD